MDKEDNNTHHTKTFRKFQHSFIYSPYFFSWQLLLRVHRHEKELQNTQKINVSTEIKTSSQAWTCFCLCQAAPSKRADLGIFNPVHDGHLTHTMSWNVQKLIPDQLTLLWGDTWRSSRPSYSYSSWYTEEERVNIICVMRPNTENLHLYTRQSQEEGFQLVITRIMNDNTLQEAL